MQGLLEAIAKADHICVASAWFTNYDLANILHDKDSQIIVDRQNVSYKEEWLKLIIHANSNSRFWSDKSSMLHHKFMVFSIYDDQGKLCPYQLWLGSANFTYNSLNNQESGLLISNPELAAVYYHNFQHLWHQCQPLRLV